MKFSPSELILNADGSVYHLNLLPEDIADTIITVGDPDRVGDVSRRFDTVELRKGKREFHTHTGTFQGKRLSVISTGIGTDNIDIVLNELDALVNIDFENRTEKVVKQSLDIIRIGTSGAIQPMIPVDSFLMSEYAMGFDGLLHFYDSATVQHLEISRAFAEHYSSFTEHGSSANDVGSFTEDAGSFAQNQNASVQNSHKTIHAPVPYIVKYGKALGDRLSSNRIRLGLTATNSGFYGPQGRKLRLKPADTAFLQKLTSFRYQNLRITNLEMETSGIYGLAQLLGHRAVSMNCILANRATGEFSKNPKKATGELIGYCLEKICG